MIDLVSTFILLAGVADDLRSRKIHNILLVGLLLLAILSVFTVRGFSGLGMGFMAAFVALALTLPLVYMGALGGGDMKLLAVFAITSDPGSVLWVLLYSLVAGAALGLMRAAVGGEFMNVVRSTALVAMDRTLKPMTTNHIPYSVALLLGWLTQAALTGGWV